MDHIDPYEGRRVIVQLVGLDHPDHPVNRAKRAAEAEAAAKAAQEAAAAAEPEPPAKKPRKRRRRRHMRSAELPAETILERHQRLCTICNHEDREAIEEEFVNWFSADSTAVHYRIERRSIYRHAHVMGLFPVRERNLRSALGHMVELASYAKPTIGGVIRAIRAYSCLSRDGQWTEMPAQVVVSSGTAVPLGRIVAAQPHTLDVASPSDPERSMDSPVLIDTRDE